MSFITEDFLLQNDLAKKLYHDIAADLPIFDYHCHLNPQQIAENHAFVDITELWLSGDHYKWRGMRANGVSEKYITGDGTSKEKFKAWAETVDAVIGNPLYHWTQLELRKYFGITQPLNSENWEEVFNVTNRIIAERPITARQLIKDSNVHFIGTTDSPVDTLEYHVAIKNDPTIDVIVAPSYRPEAAFSIQNPVVFQQFVTALSVSAGMEVTSYTTLLEALDIRAEFFDSVGCRASDHSFGDLYYEEATLAEVEAIFTKGLMGTALTALEEKQWLSYLLTDLGKMYNKYGWAMQIHFGVIRNNNSRMFAQIGVDAGFDSISDQGDIARHLNKILDALDKENQLPKTIVYNLNPSANDVVASTVANFQANEAGIVGKMQFGAGWWYNDTKQGMLRQMDCLADQGLLMNFVGMLTDSRSFISYTRHEYFRRILCQYVSEQVLSGEYPNDPDILEKIIKNICFDNAKAYFA